MTILYCNKVINYCFVPCGFIITMFLLFLTVKMHHRSILDVLYVLCKCQFSGKVCKCEFSNVLIKCGLMACWLNVAVVGLPPLAKSVAVAIAKTPQSFTPSCFGPLT